MEPRRSTAEVAQGTGRRRGLRLAATAFPVIVLLSTAVGMVTADPTTSGPRPATAAVSEDEAGLATSDSSPLDPRTWFRPSPDQTPEQAPAPTGGDEPSAPLPSSEPVAIAIPALGVVAGTMELGLHDDGTMEVPPHAPRSDSLAGWYRHSPTPGAVGPAVVVGHVDSDRHGASVFYGLDTLAEGDRIEVARGDGVTAVFEVERSAQYAKGELPMDEVFGNLDHAGLRLITCGGDFDRGRLEYRDNIVVYARMVSSHPTSRAGPGTPR